MSSKTSQTSSASKSQSKSSSSLISSKSQNSSNKSSNVDDSSQCNNSSKMNSSNSINASSGKQSSRLSKSQTSSINKTSMNSSSSANKSSYGKSNSRRSRSSITSSNQQSTSQSISMKSTTQSATQYKSTSINSSSIPDRPKLCEKIANIQQCESYVEINDENQLKSDYDYHIEDFIAEDDCYKYYLAKKNSTDILCKIIDLNKCTQRYRENLLKNSLKIIRFVGGGNQNGDGDYDNQKPICKYIIKIYEIFKCNSKIYMFMENYNGKSMYLMLLDKDNYTCEDERKWTVQIVKALIKIQEYGIAHRFLKLQHILFDSERNVKIAGWSKAVLCWDNDNDCPLLQNCERRSRKNCHLPPETFNYSVYDPSKVDIWSLGVIMVCLQTRSYPFNATAKSKFSAQWRQFVLKHEMNRYVRAACNQTFFIDPKRRVKPEDFLSHPYFTTSVTNIMTKVFKTSIDPKYDPDMPILLSCHISSTDVTSQNDSEAQSNYHSSKANSFSSQSKNSSYMKSSQKSKSSIGSSAKQSSTQGSSKSNVKTNSKRSKTSSMQQSSMASYDKSQSSAVSSSMHQSSKASSDKSHSSAVSSSIKQSSMAPSNKSHSSALSSSTPQSSKASSKNSQLSAAKSSKVSSSMTPLSAVSSNKSHSSAASSSSSSMNATSASTSNALKTTCSQSIKSDDLADVGDDNATGLEGGSVDQQISNEEKAHESFAAECSAPEEQADKAQSVSYISKSGNSSSSSSSSSATKSN